MHSHRIYGPNDAWEPGKFCSLLAIGDSWFWYPRSNVLTALVNHRRLKDPYRFIQMLGYNGARLEQYVFGRYARQLAHELTPSQRQYYSAILVSGAGNDAIKYALALKRNCSTASVPEDCIDEEALATFLRTIGAGLEALVYEIIDAFTRDGRRPPIILHSYDYPTPDGRGFKVGGLKVTGPWLSKAMDERKVPNDLHFRTSVCRILIQRLRSRFLSFAEKDRSLRLIDSCGCLASQDHRDDWDNELHPTSQGFEKIVDSKWIPLFTELGYAT